MADTRSSSIRRIEWIFAAAALFVSTNGLIPLLRSGGSAMATNPTDGDPLLEVAWLAVYLIVGWRLFWLLRSRSVSDLLQPRFMWVLVALAAISAAWSGAPEVTLRRSVALAGTNLFGVYLAYRFGRPGLMRLLVVVLAVSAAISFILPIVAPDLGLDAIRDQSWRGIYTTRNELARWMVLLAAVCLVRLSIARHSSLSYLAVLCLALGLLVQSQSKGALVVLALLCAVLGLLFVLRRDRHVAIVGASGFIALLGSAGMWVMAHPTETFDLLGRDSTLTGRSVLWQVVWGYVQDQLWLGYGFNAFWLGPESPGAYVRWLTNIDAPHAHNGLLDLWLGLGAVGVLVVGVAVTTTAIRAIRVASRTQDAADLLPSVFLAFLVLENIAESSLVTPNSCLWILFIGFSASLITPRAKAAPVLARSRHRGVSLRVQAPRAQHV